MEFVGKAIFLGLEFGPNLNGIRGQGHFGPNLIEFVFGINGIRGQGHFGPSLMEFVGKAISDQP